MNHTLKTNELKWALVTGASSGIGAAFAKRIAREGYSVVLVARRADRLQELARLIRNERGIDSIVAPLDLTHPEATDQIMRILQSRQIRVDVMFNNAGYGTNGEFCDLDLTQQLKMIDLNCKALTSLSHAIARDMQERRAGIIFHVASVGGLFPTPYYTTYGATKAFVVAFSEGLAVELAPFNVRVITLCPGATETEFETVSEFKGIRPPTSGFETADQVAETAIRALKKSQTLIISGWHNQLMACIFRMLPRQISLRLAARSMRPRMVT